jgi:hypothetical protein
VKRDKDAGSHQPCVDQFGVVVNRGNQNATRPEDVPSLEICAKVNAVLETL